MNDPIDSIWKGFALETLLLHELGVYNHVQSKNRPIHFWRTGAGVEIDFVIETAHKTMNKQAEVVAIEAKLATKWDRRWEQGARALAESGTVRMKRMIGVYQGRNTLSFDGFDVMPVQAFLRSLYAGEIF